MSSSEDFRASSGLVSFHSARMFSNSLRTLEEVHCAMEIFLKSFDKLLFLLVVFFLCIFSFRQLGTQLVIACLKVPERRP